MILINRPVHTRRISPEKLPEIPTEMPELIGDNSEILTHFLRWRWVREVLDQFDGDLVAAIMTLRVILPAGAALLEDWAHANGVKIEEVSVVRPGSKILNF